jgi:hypothetical protein
VLPHRQIRYLRCFNPLTRCQPRCRPSSGSCLYIFATAALATTSDELRAKNSASAIVYFFMELKDPLCITPDCTDAPLAFPKLDDE